jgi:hypothetical protein
MCLPGNHHKWLGFPREVIEHHLKIYPDARSVQQKP